MAIDGTLLSDNPKSSGEIEGFHASIKTRPQICLREIASLTPNIGNPRKHSRAQVRAIAKSIEAFGFNAPILAGRDGKVIAGHGRLEAAALLGLQQVPVILLDHLSEAQAKAYMLADNKLTDRSTWDDRKVAAQLKELSELAIEFDIEATGFELPEIDLRIQSLDEADAADQADEFEISPGPAVSVAGDLWHLGRHRLYCGSALDEQAYLALLQGEKAAACFTDPPYNVKIDGHVSGLGRVTHREFAMAAGEMSEQEFTEFLTSTLTSICSHIVPGALIYACMDWRHMTEMLAAGSARACELLNLCIWAKSNGGMGSLYRSRHELVFVFKNGREAHQNNIQLGRFGRNRTNVWNYAGANGFNRRGTLAASALHPTVKPISLVADAILDSTKRDGIVLDPFLGSGTTLLAAERTGRRCCGTEIDPLYVDTIIARWQSMTGLKAQTPLGETFDIVKSRRRLASHEQV
jgi:DNA modification methylase